MPDHGLALEFGLFPSPDAARHHEVLELAQLADVLGLEHVSIQDHPYQAAHLDTWTLLASIGARTSQVRLSTNVANLPLRPRLRRAARPRRPLRRARPAHRVAPGPPVLRGGAP